jgi:large subunit ribosomal protein L24
VKPLVYKKKKRTRHGPVARHKMHITKGDRVRVMRGDETGKEGTVLRVDRKHQRVVIEGVRIVKRHRQARSEADKGGIIEFEAPIDASNVMLLDPKSGEPTRIRRKRDADGTVERISVKSSQAVPRGS